MKTLLTIIALSTSMLAGTCSSQATGFWRTGATWGAGCSGAGGVPTAADTIHPAAGFTVTVDDTEAVGTIAALAGNTGTIVVSSTGNFTWSIFTSTSTGAATLHCQSGAVCNGGSNSATSHTQDSTLAATGTTLQMDNGSTFTFTSSIKGTIANIYLNGHTICNPNGVAVYQNIENSHGVNLSTGTMTVQGPDAAHPAVFETRAGQTVTGGSTGNCNIGKATGGTASNIILKHAIFNNVGDANQNGLSFNSSDCFPSTDVEDVLVMGKIGSLTLDSDAGDTTSANCGSITSTFYINGFYVIGSSLNKANGLFINDSITGIVPTAGSRQIYNVALWDPDTASADTMTLTLPYTKVGSSTIPGVMAFNWKLSNSTTLTGANIEVRNSFITQETGINVIAAGVNQNANFHDNLFYIHLPNPHTIVDAGTSNALAPNQFTNNVVDGAFFRPGDSGEFCSLAVSGTATCSYNLNINDNQNMMVPNASSALVVDHNSGWWQSSAYMNDVSVGATGISSFQYNLYDQPPSYYNTNCNHYSSGAIAINVGQFATQTAATLDHNGYYNLQNQGDPGSPSCPVLTGTVGGIGSPMGAYGFPAAPYTGLANKSVTVSGGTVTIAGVTLQTTAIVGAVVWDITQSKYAYIATIPSQTTFTYTGGNITTIANADTVDIDQPWVSSAGVAYPVGTNAIFGLDDIHAPMNWFNNGSASGVCGWYNSVTGAGLTCETSANNPGNLTITPANTTPTLTAGTSGTTLTCSTCDFVSWGVTAGDVVWLFSAAGSYSYVASVTDLHNLVVVAGGSGAFASTNQIIITGPDTVYMAIVTGMFKSASGWDTGSGSSLAGTNCTSNCPAPATPVSGLTTNAALAWIRRNYIPYNGMYKNNDCRALPCVDAGALQAWNPAIL